jgi:hypothetical protein
MKKGASILFISILLFNGFGYRIWSNYFDQKAINQFNQRIEENNYNEADLVLIKTPINLPYYANQPQFEQVQGEMVMNGVIYQYVARRIFNDSLELKVLLNQDRLHIKNAREDFYKLASDFEQSGTDKKSIPINNASSKIINFDYYNQSIKWELVKLISLDRVFGQPYQDGLLSLDLPIHTPPPKLIA